MPFGCPEALAETLNAPGCKGCDPGPGDGGNTNKCQWPESQHVWAVNEGPRPMSSAL